MDDLLNAIYNLAPIDEIRIYLQRCSPNSSHLHDPDGLDPLHHSILAGNPEAISVLHAQHSVARRGDGQISANDSKCENSLERENADSVAYLHLACLVGNVFITQSLLSAGELDRRCRSWPTPQAIRRCLKRKTGCETSEDLLTAYDLALATLLAMPDGATALDAAALALRHAGCVRLLLAGGAGGVRRHTDLELAMDAGSTHAFTYLLSLEPARKDIEGAFKQTLTQKRPDCLRALLDHGVDVASALNGLNPFHVAYVYSSGFHQLAVTRSVGAAAGVERAGGGLEGVTALLIERGFDVNAKEPLGTFPLYSLITSLVLEKDSKPSQVPMSHIRSLDLLLKAGARTNFDESRATGLPPDSPPPATTVGRELFSSALDAYFASLQSCDTWRPHVMEHLDRVCLSLLEAGADPNHVDAGGETSLHGLMRAMASQHAMGHMHADLSCMCRMLLYFGADPNRRCAGDGVWPVQLYFTVLLRSMGGLFAFRRWKCSDNASQVLQLLYFMDTPDACEASASITAELNGAAGDGMPADVVDFVAGLMAEYVCCVKSLQELSRLALWKAVARKLVNLKKLHMPRAFIAAIKELFHLDI